MPRRDEASRRLVINAHSPAQYSQYLKLAANAFFDIYYARDRPPAQTLPAAAFLFISLFISTCDDLFRRNRRREDGQERAGAIEGSAGIVPINRRLRREIGLRGDFLERS